MIIVKRRQPTDKVNGKNLYALFNILFIDGISSYQFVNINLVYDGDLFVIECVYVMSVTMENFMLFIALR